MLIAPETIADCLFLPRLLVFLERLHLPFPSGVVVAEVLKLASPSSVTEDNRVDNNHNNSADDANDSNTTADAVDREVEKAKGEETANSGDSCGESMNSNPNSESDGNGKTLHWLEDIVVESNGESNMDELDQDTNSSETRTLSLALILMGVFVSGSMVLLQKVCRALREFVSIHFLGPLV